MNTLKKLLSLLNFENFDQIKTNLISYIHKRKFLPIVIFLDEKKRKKKPNNSFDRM